MIEYTYSMQHYIYIIKVYSSMVLRILHHTPTHTHDTIMNQKSLAKSKRSPRRRRRIKIKSHNRIKIITTSFKAYPRLHDSLSTKLTLPVSPTYSPKSSYSRKTAFYVQSTTPPSTPPGSPTQRYRPMSSNISSQFPRRPMARSAGQSMSPVFVFSKKKTSVVSTSFALRLRVYRAVVQTEGTPQNGLKENGTKKNRKPFP